MIMAAGCATGNNDSAARTSEPESSGEARTVEATPKEMRAVEGQDELCADAASCRERGYQLIRTDRDAAAVAFERSCEFGSLISCAHLGGMMSWGLYGEEKVSRGAELNAKACREADDLCDDPAALPNRNICVGQVYGCANRAANFEHGQGVEKNLERALELWHWACERRELMNTNACSQIGFFHAKGMAVEQDPDEALRWYDLGCEAGEGMGCCNAAHLLQDHPELEGEAGPEVYYQRSQKLRHQCKPLAATAD
jgi:TPR repeat protein